MFRREIFASRLRGLRQERKEAQPVLADLLGVSVNQISEMERGRKTTSFERLVLLCQHYNVSSDYLLGLSDKRQPLDEKEEPEA
ncbi:helix-turn-helix domain-containing protein [uncultured Pseudoflavonifractor sp.]|uniref:helix-turn-helix domain-containing protein n=1 Tax=uncultured Pseudoflavonifractor sp. TaxID=1221379 RepID=UPI0025CBD537|nr:helix-turn-helix transcriptional regulator [uncultured Pseudoflavonifractor sp.]